MKKYKAEKMLRRETKKKSNKFREKEAKTPQK